MRPEGLPLGRRHGRPLRLRPRDGRPAPERSPAHRPWRPWGHLPAPRGWGGWSRQGARVPGGDGALEEALAEIDRLAGLPQVKGVGETGLDYFRTGPEGKAAQEKSFRAHIEIAKRHGKALVIHDRDAHADVLRVLKEEGAPSARSSTATPATPRWPNSAPAPGTSCPSPKTVTFKNAQNLRDALAVAPLELVLVETDAPFLTPAPYRGRPNAPYLVPVTVRAMAAVRGIDEDALATALAANTARAFAY